MTDKLSLYQGACLHLKERKLLSLTENRESRRVLDTVWDRQFVRTVLSHGLWNFATRVAQLNYSTDVTPPFGYRRAFDKPADWVRTMKVCQDEFFDVPLLRYDDNAGFIYSDYDFFFAAWVSDDALFGGNLGAWPVNFTKYAELFMAHEAAPRLIASKEDRDRIDKDMKMALDLGKNTDAMDEATQFAPPGTWLLSRRGRRSASRFDRGDPTQLIG